MIMTVLTIAFATALPAHNVHVSLGEAEWTSEALEVSLDVRTDDLERALRSTLSEAGIAALLAKRTALQRRGTRTPAAMSFIGYERHGATTTLFYEFAVHGAPRDYEMELTLFFTLERSQKHTVVVTHGTAQQTLHYDMKHHRQPLWRKVAPTPSK